MSTLDEITKEKQRINEALARVDMQREKLASQLGELEATERVLARYSKGTQLRQSASARTPATATKAAAPARRRGRPPTTTAKAAGGKRSSSNLGDQVLALATGKTQQEIAAACARALAPTMSAPPFHATSGRAALKSAMGNSTPYSQRVRSNRPRSDTGIKECRSTPKGVGRYPPRGTGDASREASGQSTYKPIPRAEEPRSAGNCRRDVASIETPNNRILGVGDRG